MRKFAYILFLGVVYCCIFTATSQPVDTLSLSHYIVEIDSMANHNNGAFNDNFKQHYKGDEFNYIEPNDVKNINSSNINTSVLGSILEFIFSIILPLILIVALSIGVYYLPSYLKQKNTHKLARQKADELVSTEHHIEDIHEIDFKKHIKEALEKKAYTHAIRWSYLYNLKLMDDKNMIDWQPKKTNRDYYYELNQDQLKKDFKYLTYVYNNLWFGQFKIDQNEANQILSKFQSFQLILNKS